MWDSAKLDHKLAGLAESHGSQFHGIHTGFIGFFGEMAWKSPSVLWVNSEWTSRRLRAAEFLCPVRRVPSRVAAIRHALDRPSPGSAPLPEFAATHTDRPSLDRVLLDHPSFRVVCFRGRVRDASSIRLLVRASAPRATRCVAILHAGVRQTACASGIPTVRLLGRAIAPRWDVRGFISPTASPLIVRRPVSPPP